MPKPYKNRPMASAGYNTGLPPTFPYPGSPMSPTAMMPGSPMSQYQPGMASPAQQQSLYAFKARTPGPNDPFGMKIHINTASGASPAEALQKAANEYREMERRQQGKDDDYDDGCCCTVS